jgi:hypothetical protein
MIEVGWLLGKEVEDSKERKTIGAVRCGLRKSLNFDLEMEI